MKFVSLLNGTFTSVTLKGSRDATGVTCTGSEATLLCQALGANAFVSVSCGGKSWEVVSAPSLPGGFPSMQIDANGTNGTCTTTGAYTARPCAAQLFSNGIWGGIKDDDCAGATQTIEVVCRQ